MIEFIHIQRFKTLLDADFPLSYLNLFTGLNGMGKSSLVQALLLLRQSFERNTLEKRGLLLKGDYLSLGVGKDILSAQAETNTMEFTVKWSSRASIKFSFIFAAQSDLQPLSEAVRIEYPERISLFNHNFQYLAADRIGPQNAYELSDFHIRDLNSLGNRGEYAVHFIAENSLKNISTPPLRHSKATAENFLENLNAWMSEISPGIRIHATTVPQTNSATLAYSFIQGKEPWETDDFKPQNVGFGISFALPVVTALLRAKPGDLIILENPESHLHPAAQTLIGKLCALVAANGIQLIVESHSDHFLNGIRVAVKQKMITPGIIRIYFLDRNQKSASHSSDVYNPCLDEMGRMDQWPSGFFDEWERQLEKLL
jgi:predicted ATPase